MPARSEPLLWVQLIGAGVFPLEGLLLLLLLAGSDPGPFPALERLLCWGLGGLAPTLLLWRRPADVWSLLLLQTPLRARRPLQQRLSRLQDNLGLRLGLALAGVFSLPLLWWLDEHAAVASPLSPLQAAPRLVVLLLAALLLALMLWQWQQLLQALWLLSRSPEAVAAARPMPQAELEQRHLCLGLPLLLLDPLQLDPSPPSAAARGASGTPSAVSLSAEPPGQMTRPPLAPERSSSEAADGAAEQVLPDAEPPAVSRLQADAEVSWPEPELPAPSSLAELDEARPSAGASGEADSAPVSAAPEAQQETEQDAEAGDPEAAAATSPPGPDEPVSWVDGAVEPTAVPDTAAAAVGSAAEPQIHPATEEASGAEPAASAAHESLLDSTEPLPDPGLSGEQPTAAPDGAWAPETSRDPEAEPMEPEASEDVQAPSGMPSEAPAAVPDAAASEAPAADVEPTPSDQPGGEPHAAG